MKIHTLCFAGLAAFTATLAMGGAFDPALVPQDARWVAHMDVAAFRDSTIGQHLSTQEVHADVQEQWKQAEEMLGMDLREDLHAVTMYGSGVEQDDLVIWFRGRLDPATLASQAAEQDQYQSSEYAGHTIHSWVDNSAEESVRVYGAVLDDTRAVLGPNEEQLQRALGVLSGDHPNVTDGGISVSPLTGSGVLMAATADFRDVDLSENPMFAQSPMRAQSFRMDMRETDGMLGVRVVVQQESDQEAQQVLEMLNGLKMMGIMQLQQQNPDLAGFLQAITINRRDNNLLFNLSYPSVQIVSIIEDTAAAMPAQ